VYAALSAVARGSEFPVGAATRRAQEYRDTIDETERRVARVTEQLRQLTPGWRWAPVVDDLQSLRGVSFVTAVGLVVEVGDIRRFDHPRELMTFLGLVPSEYNSSPSSPKSTSATRCGSPGWWHWDLTSSR
jgi:transposase